MELWNKLISNLFLFLNILYSYYLTAFQSIEITFLLARTHENRENLTLSPKANKYKISRILSVTLWGGYLPYFTSKYLSKTLFSVYLNVQMYTKGKTWYFNNYSRLTNHFVVVFLHKRTENKSVRKQRCIGYKRFKYWTE